MKGRILKKLMKPWLLISITIVILIAIMAIIIQNDLSGESLFEEKYPEAQNIKIIKQTADEVVYSWEDNEGDKYITIHYPRTGRMDTTLIRKGGNN